jgi:hypothetical protein
MSQSSSWLARSYGSALWLYPPAFRRRFGDGLRHDFEYCLADARRAGDVPTFLARTGGDLAWTIVAQWLRPGLPFTTLVPVLSAAMVVGVLTQLESASRWTHVVDEQEEAIWTLLLLLGTVFFVVVATIFLTQYLLWPRCRPRRAGGVSRP